MPSCSFKYTFDFINIICELFFPIEFDYSMLFIALALLSEAYTVQHVLRSDPWCRSPDGSLPMHHMQSLLIVVITSLDMTGRLFDDFPLDNEWSMSFH
jgi:hypothetical protein